MKKYFTASFIILSLLLTATSYAQSIYSRSIENSLSTIYSLGMTGDDKNIGIGAAYTINSSVDLGFVYTIHRDKTKENEHGQGWGGFASYMLMNELKGSSIGLSIGILYSQITIGDSYSSTEAKIFGIGLNASKNFQNKMGSIAVVPQIGFTFLPINEVETTFATDAQLNFTTTLAIGFPLRMHPKATLIIEPNTIYSYRANMFISGFSIALLFSHL